MNQIFINIPQVKRKIHYILGYNPKKIDLKFGVI